MKKVLMLIIILLLIPVTVFSLVSPSSVLYVTDEGRVLSDRTEDYIVQYSDFLSKSNQISYYVVTVKNTESYNVDDYAEEVYKSFGLGKKGILIFFTKEERVIKVIVGEELSSFLTDEVIQESIQLYFMPYFKNDDWDNGIRNGYSAFYKMICNYYDIDSSAMEVFDGNDFITKYQYPLITGLVFLGYLISSAFCNNLKKGYRKKDSRHFFYFGLYLFLSIMILLFAYYISPLSIILIIGTEIVTFFGIFSSGKKVSLEDAYRMSQQKKKTTKKKKVSKRKH